MILAVLAIASLASSFNLECSGNAYQTMDLLGPKQNERQFEIEYRVDLAKGRYCRNACITTFALTKVTETQIIFEMEERNALDDTIVFVNRENGKYYDRDRRFLPPNKVIVNIEEGSCKSTPFTGFPDRKF